MENFISFLGRNFVWFLTVTILLVFALIGYIYDTKKNKNDLVKKSEEEINEENIENIMVTEEKSLNDMVSKSKNINPQTKAVELNDPNILNKGSEENIILPGGENKQ